MATMGGKNFIGAAVPHLLYDEHDHDDDKPIAHKHNEIEELPGQALVLHAQHVPHQDGPHEHVHGHPAQQQPPLRQRQDGWDD